MPAGSLATFCGAAPAPKRTTSSFTYMLPPAGCSTMAWLKRPGGFCLLAGGRSAENEGARTQASGGSANVSCGQQHHCERPRTRPHNQAQARARVRRALVRPRLRGAARARAALTRPLP